MENKPDPIVLPPLQRKSLFFETVGGVFIGALSAVIGVPVVDTMIRSWGEKNKHFQKLILPKADANFAKEVLGIAFGYSIINGYLSFRDAIKYNRELEAIELRRQSER
jgi:hypothetical protein